MGHALAEPAARGDWAVQRSLGPVPSQVMSVEVEVRPVQSQDRDQWAQLFRAYREFYELQPDEAVVERVWSWLVDPAHEVDAFVAELDGRVVGIAH